MFEFVCPKCSENVKAAEDQSGDSILCPKCAQTIRVPGQSKSEGSNEKDDWSLFDEDEKFIEESVTETEQPKYRTREDDREALVDNDEEEARREELEEKAAVAETFAKTKSFDLATGPSTSSDMTIDEKIRQDARFKKEQAELEALGKVKKEVAWDRDQGESPRSLTLDGEPTGSKSLSVRCPVCDSVTMVAKNKEGRSIVCSDCGSPVTVPTEEENSANSTRKNQEWERWARKGDESSSPQTTKPKIPEDLFAGNDDEDEYGLAPAPDNLLQPVMPVYVESDEPEAVENQTEEPTTPNRLAQESEERAHLESSKLFDEMQAENDVQFEKLPWREHIFGLLIDPGFLIRTALVVLVMIVGYSIFAFPSGMVEMEGGRAAKVASFLGKFIRMWSFPFIPVSFLLVCWVGQVVLNTTISGEKKLPDIEGVSPVIFVSNCLFIVVGFAVSGFAGGLVGGLIWTQISEWQGFWVVIGMSSFSALLLSPLLIMSSMHNQNPFKISSKKIVESLKTESDAWIEFYFSAGIVALVMLGLWCLAMTENWFVVLMVFIATNLMFGLYFRMLGRLMGIVVTRKKKKKKKRST